MTLRPALHTAMASVQASFAQLLEYLQREEEVLKDLGAPDLKACLRTGAGTKGHTENPERMKFYKILIKILNNTEDLSQEQRQQIADWEARICSSQESETSFAQFTNILQRRKSDLQNLGKTSLQACFMTNKSNQDKDLKFGQNFFRRKASSFSEEQKQELAKWEAEICGDGVAWRPAVDKEYTRLLEILESRKSDLQNLGKTSLEDCFSTNQSNQDKDLKFGQNFFRRKAASLSEEQKQILTPFEVEICNTVNFDDFNRFVSILQDRAEELAELRFSDFTALLSRRTLKENPEVKFCATFWRRNASRLNSAERLQVEELQAAILRSTADFIWGPLGDPPSEIPPE